MYEQIKKPKQNKSREIAKFVVQNKNSTKQGSGFVDNRTEAITQMKLQNMANNSHLVKKLKAFQEISYNNPQALQVGQLQAKTIIQSLNKPAPMGLRNIDGSSGKMVGLHIGRHVPLQRVMQAAPKAKNKAVDPGAMADKLKELHLNDLLNHDAIKLLPFTDEAKKSMASGHCNVAGKLMAARPINYPDTTHGQKQALYDAHDQFIKNAPSHEESFSEVTRDVVTHPKPIVYRSLQGWD